MAPYCFLEPCQFRN